MPYQMEGRQGQQMPRGSSSSWLGGWQGWLNIILFFLVLEIAVLSIEQAQWITPQPSLTLVLFLAVLTGWLLVKSRLPNAATYTLAMVLGVMVTVWQVYSILPTLGTVSKFNQLMMALQSWWQTTGVVTPSEETTSFAVFLIFLTWVIGYVSTWFILRRQNPWVAVSLGAVVILVNLSNLAEKNYVLFGFYFLMAMFLIIQTRLAKQHYWLQKHGTSYPKQDLLYFVVSLLCLGILAVSISWLTPEIRVPQLETMIATKILWKYDVEESRLNFFAPVRAKEPFSTRSTHKDLSFGEVWHHSDEVHFVVTSSRPSYWRAHVYDTYTSEGWTSSLTTAYLLEQGVPWVEAKMFPDRSKVTYTVDTNLKTDILLTAGTFVSSDTPVLVHVGTGDVVAVTAPRILRPDESYTVTAGIFSATPAGLSVAGEDYPQSITANYLQLPPDLPERVRQLSEDVTKEAKSPYEKVLAIQDYLSQLPYEVEVEAPPEGIDGVDYFLFTQKSGFCVYYASAMAVMLRSVDVPSRLVVGYLPGELDPSPGKFILRDKHYHAWLQAYFPGYGWVDLEPTARADSEGEGVGGVGGDGDDSLFPAYYLEEWMMWEEWEEWLGQGEIILRDSADTKGWDIDFPRGLGLTLLIIIFGTIFIILLASPILALRSAFYRWFWRLRRPDSASMVYAKMCALASLVKMGPEPQQTPLEYTAELAAALPLQAEALDNIVHVYVENQFSRRREGIGLLEEAKLLKFRHEVYPILFHRLVRRRWLLLKAFINFCLHRAPFH